MDYFAFWATKSQLTMFASTVSANFVYNNTNRATSTTLSRAFTLAQQNVNLLTPGSLYGDRLNQLDLRIGKVLEFAGTRASLNLDLYNAFNANPVLGQINNFGPAWQTPLFVLPDAGSTVRDRGSQLRDAPRPKFRGGRIQRGRGERRLAGRSR